MSALPTHPAHGLPVALPPPLPFIDGEPSRVEQYAPPGHCPLAPPELLSALLFGCGLLGSPEVPAVPDVECEDAPVPADACFAEPADDFLLDGDALCVAAVELPCPGSATARPPPTPREMITSASTAEIAANGRARSSQARDIEVPANP